LAALVVATESLPVSRRTLQGVTSFDQLSGTRETKCVIPALCWGIFCVGIFVLGIFLIFIFLGGAEKEEEEEMEMIGIHKKTYENVTETGDWINRPMQLNAPSTVDVAAVVQQAEKAAQRCGCEGR